MKKYLKLLVVILMMTISVSADSYEIKNDIFTPIAGSAEGGGYEITQADMFPYIFIVRKKAIIVAGGGDDVTNFLWNATQLCADYAYLSLLAQGYSNDDIYYLTPTSSLKKDFNGNKLEGIIDKEATYENLHNAIVTWASNADELLLYMVDHGGPGAFRINISEILNAEQLDEYLDDLQTTSLSGRVIMIYDACQSGSFIPLMIPPEGRERIIITSAEENATFSLGGGHSFSYHFWSSIITGADLNRAFFYAKNIMEDKQTALVDTNGDGIAEGADGKLLSGIPIGEGNGIGGNLPYIEEVGCDKSILNGQEPSKSVTIWANNIIDEDGISEVWAIITPPSFDPGPPDEPITDLPSVKLTDADKNGIYEGAYDCFTQKGIYKIDIYAIDAKGFYSLPRETTVEQTVSYEIIPGDFDNNGNVDLNDAILVFKLSVRMDTNNINSCADIDGKIGMEEVIYILQKVSGLRSQER